MVKENNHSNTYGKVINFKDHNKDMEVFFLFEYRAFSVLGDFSVYFDLKNDWLELSSVLM